MTALSWVNFNLKSVKFLLLLSIVRVLRYILYYHFSKFLEQQTDQDWGQDQKE